MQAFTRSRRDVGFYGRRAESRRWRVYSTLQKLAQTGNGFLRGYAAGFGASRSKESDRSGLGLDLRTICWILIGVWQVGSHMMGETIPKKREWFHWIAVRKMTGVSVVKNAVDYDENAEKMKKDYIAVMTEMFTDAVSQNIRRIHTGRLQVWISMKWVVHVWATIRKLRYWIQWNQMHAVKNVFAQRCKYDIHINTKSSLTYMAFSARSVDYAVSEMKKGIFNFTGERFWK